MRSIRGQSCDQIQSDLLKGKRVFWSRDAIQWGAFAVGNILILLACCTSRDVFGGPRSHSGPPVNVGDLSEGFIPSGMSRCWGIME